MTSGFLWLENMLLTVLALIVLVICGWCVYAFVHAIFLFIFSQGDEEKKKSAWNSIRYMIIGIILTIFLLTIFPVIFNQLKVTGYEVYTARNVFDRAGEIINKLFEFGKVVRDTNTGSTPSYNYDADYSNDFSL